MLGYDTSVFTKGQVSRLKSQWQNGPIPLSDSHSGIIITLGQSHLSDIYPKSCTSR